MKKEVRKGAANVEVTKRRKNLVMNHHACYLVTKDHVKKDPVKNGHATIADHIECQMMKIEGGVTGMKNGEKESGRRDIGIVITGEIIRGIVLRAVNRVILIVMMMMGIADGLLCHLDVDAGMTMISTDE